MKKLLMLFAVAAIALAGCEKDDAATAKIGDFYYSDDSYSATLNADKTCVGLVFCEKTADQYGLIVGLEEDELPWTSLDIITLRDLRWRPSGTTVSGALNMAEIQKNDGWEDNFPAFKWCSDKGTGWYLPSENELLLLYKKWNSNRTAFNAKLTAAGGTELSDFVLGYWSSTMSEQYDNNVISIRFNNGQPANDPIGGVAMVRAVRQF